MVSDKEEIAQKLIKWHFQVEPELREVYLISSDDDPIKLLEVNNAAVETGEVIAFGFAKTDEIPFPSLVAEVTPLEFERIQRKEIPLPKGWDLNTARRFLRSIAS